jgi:hypothetical protein
MALPEETAGLTPGFIVKGIWSLAADFPRLPAQRPPYTAASAKCWPPRFSCQLVVASWRCLAVGAHMDSGRFNFWRLLLCTRAITPPRVPAALWPGSVFLLLVAVFAAGVVVRLSQRDAPLQSSANDPLPTSAPLGPAPSAQHW